MDDSIFLEGREYVSAKRASETSGYARDYIGQLARKGLIGAQRVGGLWYVSMESLQGYQKNADAYQPVPPLKQGTELESTVSFDGKDYISASRAAKISGYNQDYIGQLARAGKILSRQIGNRWYVERSGLLGHKVQKDSLLAAVQKEAVGLQTPALSSLHGSKAFIGEEKAYFTYVAETDRELMPKLKEEYPELMGQNREQRHAIPIRVVHTPAPEIRPSTHIVRRDFIAVRKPRKTMRRAVEVGVALTFVIVLSYGLVTLKTSSVYTFNSSGVTNSISRMVAVAAVSKPMESVGAFLETMFSKELIYKRGN